MTLIGTLTIFTEKENLEKIDDEEDEDGDDSEYHPHDDDDDHDTGAEDNTGSYEAPAIPEGEMA